jgi:ABC-type xylose transport system permease subunit
VVTAIVFLTWRHRQLPDVSIQPHTHRWLLAGAVFSALVMGFLLVAFFIFGPRAIGQGIDQTLVIMLVLGLVFVAATARRVRGAYIFHGHDTDVAPPDRAPTLGR